ncbi:DUF2024 family protein [Aquimarina atlantica]|nr:DUF2024 family protein [Aquimarina atlantica]
MMKIAVWDTYVQRNDGIIMHFDILVPDSITDQDVVFKFGENYLESKPFKTEKITTNECRLCHIELATPEMIHDIEIKGYSIIEMENC